MITNASLYPRGRCVLVHHRQGKMIDCFVGPIHGNRGSPVMVWGATHHGGSDRWSWMVPYTATATLLAFSRQCNTTYCMQNYCPVPGKNSIEHRIWPRSLFVWIGGHPPSNVAELWQAVSKAWHALGRRKYQVLVKNMQWRVYAVLTASQRGSHAILMIQRLAQ